jgi:hypothetical protein
MNKYVRSLNNIKRVAGKPTSTDIIQSRFFYSTPQRCTDGVYPELTAMRVRIPWIQALRQKEENSTNSEPPKRADPDLTPKKMSDSYHRIVSHPANAICKIRLTYTG